MYFLRLPTGSSPLHGRGHTNREGAWLFALALLSGLGYIGVHLTRDLDHATVDENRPYMLLGLALTIALGAPIFVNGFHDTANAVATVIYTHSLTPNIAVVLSGICNLAGVLLSSGTVAFAVITLLPVELILKVSSGAGLRDGVCAADRGDPVEPGDMVVRARRFELAHHGGFDHRRGIGEPAHEYAQRRFRTGLGTGAACLEALLISPLIGFALAGFTMLAAKRLVKIPALYETPKDKEPPPWPIRALMVLTCTGVSFFFSRIERHSPEASVPQTRL